MASVHDARALTPNASPAWPPEWMKTVDDPALSQEAAPTSLQPVPALDLEPLEPTSIEPQPTPWRATLARLAERGEHAKREAWGRRANALEEQGLDWRAAEAQAAAELEAGTLPELPTIAEPTKPAAADPPTVRLVAPPGLLPGEAGRARSSPPRSRKDSPRVG